MSNETEIRSVATASEETQDRPVKRKRSLRDTLPVKYSGPIYEHLYLLDSDDSGTFRCISCDMAVKKGGGGQSNLKKHFKRHHKNIYDKLDSNKGKTPSMMNYVRKKPESMKTLESGESSNSKQTQSTSGIECLNQGIAVPETEFGSQEYYKKGGNRYTQCKRSLAEMICSDIQPVSIVNDPGFLKYSYALNPKFLVPSRETIEIEINKLYEDKKAEILSKFETEIDYYCITFDIWTSRAMKSFISLTVHYVDKTSWELESKRLGALPFPGEHTAPLLAEKVDEMLDIWQLQKENLVAVTCDNASVNIKCCQEFLHVLRFPCFGHVINLAVQDGLKVRGISEAIARCRKLVEHFKKSKVMLDRLEEVQTEHNSKKLRLIQDVETRWNSCYMMIARLLKLKDILTKIVDEKLPHPNAPKPVYFPTEAEWNLIAQIAPILMPFYDVTVWMSSSSYVTVSAVAPSLRMLKKTVCILPNDLPSVRNLKERIMAKMDKYFDKNEELELDKRTYLDPRFREFNHRIEMRSIIEKELTSDLEKMIDQREKFSTAPESTAYLTLRGSSPMSTKDPSESPKKKLKGLERLLMPVLGTMSSEEPTLNNTQKAVTEIVRYNALPGADINTNPLMWWQVHEKTLPNLSLLVRKSMCVVATSVPSECLFSTAGDIVSGVRSRLLPDNVHKLSFLHDNIQSCHLPQYKRMRSFCPCKACKELVAAEGFDRP